MPQRGPCRHRYSHLAVDRAISPTQRYWCTTPLGSLDRGCNSTFFPFVTLSFRRGYKPHRSRSSRVSSRATFIRYRSFSPLGGFAQRYRPRLISLSLISAETVILRP